MAGIQDERPFLMIGDIESAGSHEAQMAALIVDAKISEGKDEALLTIRTQDGRSMPAHIKKVSLFNREPLVGRYIWLDGLRTCARDKKWFAGDGDFQTVLDLSKGSTSHPNVMPASYVRDKFPDRIVANRTISFTSFADMQPNRAYNVYAHVRNVESVATKDGNMKRVLLTDQSASMTLLLSHSFLSANPGFTIEPQQPLLATNMQCTATYFSVGNREDWSFILRPSVWSNMDQCPDTLVCLVGNDTHRNSIDVWPLSDAALNNRRSVTAGDHKYLTNGFATLQSSNTPVGNYVMSGKLTNMVNFGSTAVGFAQPRCKAYQLGQQAHHCTMANGKVNCSVCGCIGNIDKAAYCGYVTLEDDSGVRLENVRLHDASGKFLTNTTDAMSYIMSISRLSSDSLASHMHSVRHNNEGRKFIFALWKHLGEDKCTMVYHLSNLLPMSEDAHPNDANT